MPIQSYKIMIIDDDPDIPELIREILDSVENTEFQFIICDNGQLGYIRAKETLPDLIFLDIYMPRWDGFQTYSKLSTNESTEKIPVVFLTAAHDKEDIAKARDLKVRHYLVKPFDQETLIKKTKELLSIV